MRAVVTGAAGFIGTNLSAGLVARGHHVVGIDRRVPAVPTAHRHVALDLAHDPTSSGLAPLVADADVVFHLAGRPGVRDRRPGIEALRFRDNVVATDHVLSVTPLDAHVVATSSSSVYGGARPGPAGPRPSVETDALRPIGGYARSKAAMEDRCRRWRHRGGSITVVRPFTVAGEHQRPDMAFRLWLAALERGEPIEILGSAERSRDITDVADVVEGLIRAAERRVDDTVNLGTGTTHRLADLARVVVEVVGGSADLVHAPVPTGDVDATLASTERCATLLGFTPTTDLHDVVARIVGTASLPAAAVAS